LVPTLAALPRRSLYFAKPRCATIAKMASAVTDQGCTNSGRRTLVAWDFDHSLVDDNTDTYVVERLTPDVHQQMRARYSDIPQWTDLCRWTFREMARVGVTREKFEACLATLPCFKENVEAVKLIASTVNADQVIISDSNTVLIDVVLRAQGIAECFPEGKVFTNPASWIEMDVQQQDSDNTATKGDCHEVLDVDWFQDRSSPHSCPWSPPNMCKGDILDSVRANLTGASATAVAGNADNEITTIYVGDGQGDLSAVLRMSPGDHVLARAGYSLLKNIRQLESQQPSPSTPRVHATVHSWASGVELLSTLQKLLQNNDHSEPLSV